jgi:hypothetical protein
MELIYASRLRAAGENVKASGEAPATARQRISELWLVRRHSHNSRDL